MVSDFKTSLFLIACDASGTAQGTLADVIFIKEYSITNMHQAAAMDYANESVDLSQVAGLANGKYRLGVWVNSDYGVPQPPDVGGDNVYFITKQSSGDKFASIINYTSGTTAVVNSLQDLGVTIPNPLSQYQFNNVISENNFDSVEVYNLIGQKQNVHSLSNGVYVTKVSKNNKFYTGKIIVQ